ncbi:MAG: queuosine precursor transporter [Anaerolineae bacterium]|nr:queuosine precursor transporter [Anaerolineae bacterium]
MTDNRQSLPRKPGLEMPGAIVVAAYVAAQMLSDILSLKIARVAGFSVDAGTFVYPFTFTLRDMLHKLAGRRVARGVIVAAGVINLVMAGLFAFAAWLPADAEWLLQEEFRAVLAPVWRIVIASIVAEVISELVDTEAYHFWVTRVTRRFQWARVLFSNALSIPVDSLLFVFGAFWGQMSAGALGSVFAANLAIKGGVTLLSLPGIYLAGKRDEE